MKYNTDLKPLQLPEYGRIIQSLVEQCKATENKEERNKIAHAIVHFMELKNPQLKEQQNFKHKLWDHLFIIAQYDLDVDSPFPIQHQEKSPPEKMQYPKLKGDFKFYGKSILQLIEKAIEITDEEEKQALIKIIANNMKKAHNVYQKEAISDEVIFRHLEELSNHQLSSSNIEALEKNKNYFNHNKNNHNKNNHFNHKRKNRKPQSFLNKNKK